MKSALEGIRVIDWTVGQQGPVATMMLGDLGADVIKLESPEGEMGRTYLVRRHNEYLGRNFYFEANNRNKRGIFLDLKKEESREIVYRLVEKSDVFVQNWRKGVAGRLGMGYKTLSKYNPKLVYASASAFGPEGPESGKPGLDITGLARSGIMMSMGHPDWPPVMPQAGLADQIGAMMLSWGILAALVARERTGVGQELHASLLGSMTFAQGLNVMCHLIQGSEYGRRDRADARNAMWNYYRCADEQWLVLSMSSDARYWHDFCAIMEICDLEKDPRFSTSDKRAENNRDLIAILDKIFASKPRSEWLEKLGQNKDFLYSPINTICDLASDPQVLLNQYVVDFDHPVWGQIKELGFPVTFTKTPASIRREAPMLGQHTEEVLMDVLGYTWEEIAGLRERGLICC